jgi:hypothetical protein
MNEPIRLVYESLLVTAFPRSKDGLTWNVEVGQRVPYSCRMAPANRISESFWSVRSVREVSGA